MKRVSPGVKTQRCNPTVDSWPWKMKTFHPVGFRFYIGWMDRLSSYSHAVIIYTCTLLCFMRRDDSSGHRSKLGPVLLKNARLKRSCWEKSVVSWVIVIEIFDLTGRDGIKRYISCCRRKRLKSFIFRRREHLMVKKYLWIMKRCGFLYRYICEK